MEIKDKYYTVKSYNKVEIKITKSTFIAELFPVENTDEVSKNLKAVKERYYDARHHPYAYRLGLDENNFRANDDGEPSGSSGKPILEVIDKSNITNVLIVVTRYFGGVKLGVGGLRRAYSETALASIEKNNIIEKFITEKIQLEFNYEYISPVMNFLESNNYKISENISEDKVKLICEVRLSFSENFKKELVNFTKGSIIIS